MSDPQTRSPRLPRAFPAVLAVYGAVVGLTLALILRVNDGAFTYTMDDAYIHLTMARNLVTNGTYGVVSGVPEPASSSPLWTGGLATVSWAPSAARWVPLVVNVVAGGWILYRLTSFPVTRRLANGPLGWSALLLLPVTLGLPALAFTGMEHVLHAVVVIELLLLLAAHLARPPDGGVPARWWVGLAALCATGMALRLETALVVVGLGVAALWADRVAGPWWRRLRFGVVAGVGSAAGLAVVVLTSSAAGEHPLPNSVLGKAAVADAGFAPDLDEALRHLRFDLLVLGALVLLVIALLARTPRTTRAPALAMLVTFVLHLGYIDYGLLARYRGYLLIGAVAASLLSLEGSPLVERQRGRLELAALLVLLVVPRLDYVPLTWQAANDVHVNQEQMGRFLAEAYDGQTVAVNDIGMVAYHHDGPLVDLLGLGSSDVLDAMLDDERDAAFVADLFERRDVEVMVAYDPLFEKYVPDDWVRVRRWCYDERVVLARECVGFFAPPDGVERLDRELADYEQGLPDRVRVEVERRP